MPMARFAARDERTDEASAAYEDFLETFPGVTRLPIANLGAPAGMTKKPAPAPCRVLNRRWLRSALGLARWGISDGDDLIALIYLPVWRSTSLPAHDHGAGDARGEKSSNRARQYAAAIETFHMRFPAASPLQSGAQVRYRKCCSTARPQGGMPSRILRALIARAAQKNRRGPCGIWRLSKRCAEIFRSPP